MDLLEFWRGVLPARKVLRLIKLIPDTGAFAAHLAAEPPAPSGPAPSWAAFYGWGADRHLAADAVDLFIAAHTDARRTPQRVPRPSAKPAGTPLSQLMPKRGPSRP